MHELSYGDPSCDSGQVMTKGPMQIKQPSVLDNLRTKKQSLEAQLANVNEAIEALEANPETVRIIDLLGKARF